MSLFTHPHLLDNQRWKNRRVGILGGSFNPPHEGHLHISIAALKAMQLDCVWWLVTPQNPLKNEKPLTMDERLDLCRDMANHPQILVSDLEDQLGTNITFHTIREIKKNFPRTEFVWISGMDNALSLHTWNHWQDLLAEICMVHLSRAPASSLISQCPLKMYTKQEHIFIDKAARYPLYPNTTYWMLQKKMVNVSSTEIREAAKA